MINDDTTILLWKNEEWIKLCDEFFVSLTLCEWEICCIAKAKWIDVMWLGDIGNQSGGSEDNEATWGQPLKV